MCGVFALQRTRGARHNSGSAPRALATRDLSCCVHHVTVYLLPVLSPYLIHPTLVATPPPPSLSAGALLSDTYAGFLNIGNGKHVHYIFMASLNNPKADPLIYWSNGGPGCSSSEGMFAELGPYFITPGSNPPTLFATPNTIAKMGSLRVFDAPAGVGYSYADTPAGLVHNDTTTAADNLAALQLFFKGFPEYAANDLYLSGESYAGVYIPTLANAVVNYNAGSPKTRMNLKGIAVGNVRTQHTQKLSLPPHLSLATRTHAGAGGAADAIRGLCGLHGR